MYRLPRTGRLCGFLLLFFAATVIWAGSQPKFSIISLLKPPATILVTDTVNAAYQVTNNTLVARNLTMVPVGGVAQNVVLPGACQKPFTLNPGQSCILILTISGNQIGTGIAQGPVICKTSLVDNSTPDPFLCSQPSSQDILRVAVG